MKKIFENKNNLILFLILFTSIYLILSVGYDFYSKQQISSEIADKNLKVKDLKFKLGLKDRSYLDDYMDIYMMRDLEETTYQNLRIEIDGLKSRTEISSKNSIRVYFDSDFVKNKESLVVMYYKNIEIFRQIIKNEGVDKSFFDSNPIDIPMSEIMK